MENLLGRSFDGLDPRQYMHIVFEKVMQEINITPAYEVIFQINDDFADVYDKLSLELTNPEKPNTVLDQITSEAIDFPIRKFFETIRSNYYFNKLDFNQFRQLVIHEFQSASKLETETIDAKNEVLDTLIELHFGNIRKIIASKYFEVSDENMRNIYFQCLEGFERTLKVIDEKNKETPILDKIRLLSQVTFPSDEEEFKIFFEKNLSLKESVISVQKLESIAIMTRMLSEGGQIESSILAKEALVSWRNEISEITKIAKEEKRLRKEEAKRKKIQFSDDATDILYNDIVPRLLQKKNLKAILPEIKNKYTQPQLKKALVEVLQKLNPVEKEFMSLLLMEETKSLYKNFDQNEFEDHPVLYFAVLYKALYENNIDFLSDIVKNREEHYSLRMASRKLFFIKMLQNTKIKNPVGENRINGAFLMSFERIILNDQEPLEVIKENLIHFSKMVLTGFPDFSESFNNDLNDLLIKIYADLLDVNLVNKFANLKKLSAKENKKLELLKDAFKLYEAITKELSNNDKKPRDQARRNEFLLAKIERKLASSVKKIRTKSVSF